MIKLCGKKKEIENSLWSVFTSFGFCEIEKFDENDLSGDTAKYCFFDKNSAGVINSGLVTKKSQAEVVAACIEATLINGTENIKIEIPPDAELFDLLVVFGFEKVVKINSEMKNGFLVKCGKIEFAKGCFSGKVAVCKIDMDRFMEVLAVSGVDMSENDPSASLIFAEKNAEGLAYDVAYNLRVNGCIVEYYNEDGDIEKACEYAEKKGLSCVLRAYSDGKLQIKDFLKQEIIETTVNEFLGYYEDNESCVENCHNHEDCSCEDHNHDHDCGCGHNH
ncbi:MAG: hypothetical protein PUB42_08025 [Firmicutes bacterium]|nr:hypothetical protein [Bacillota bacterium]